MLIILIGYRGSGKTTVAAPLASRLGWSWIDADTLLESRAGQSIRDIFKTEGEPGFRRREREIMAELLQSDQLVIAAGGGAILNPDTRREMKAAGPVVWLNASVPTLAARIAADASTAARRPNLSTGGMQEIIEILAQREPLYRECATIVIDTDQLATAEIVDRIVNQLPFKP